MSERPVEQYERVKGERGQQRCGGLLGPAFIEPLVMSMHKHVQVTP